MERFEQLRRMAETRGFGGNNMSTIQAIRDSFLPPGGFTLPVTAPLGIPASDLARIAVTVPDPAAANGEATSGTGNNSTSPTNRLQLCLSDILCRFYIFCPFQEPS